MCNNEKKSSEKKITAAEFIAGMKDLLEKAPKEVIFSINVLESMDLNNPRKEGIISLQGSPQNLVFMFNQAFNRAPEVKQIFSHSVEFHEIYNQDLSPAQLFLRSFLRKG